MGAYCQLFNLNSFSHDRQRVYTLDTARQGNFIQKIFSIPPQR